MLDETVFRPNICMDTSPAAHCCFPTSAFVMQHRGQLLKRGRTCCHLELFGDDLLLKLCVVTKSTRLCRGVELGMDSGRAGLNCFYRVYQYSHSQFRKENNLQVLSFDEIHVVTGLFKHPHCRQPPESEHRNRSLNSKTELNSSHLYLWPLFFLKQSMSFRQVIKTGKA